MKQFALAIVLILALISTSILGCDNNDKEDELDKQIEALSSDLSETHRLLLASLGIEEITPESIEVAIPGSVTDDEGRTVTIDEIPERILSLAPNCTEILYALGLGDKVVGRTDYCDYPEEVQDKPSVGSTWGFDLEEIAVLEPDLVLSVPGDIVSQLEGLDLTVIVTKAETINDILQNIALIGGVTGKAEEAATLIDELEQDLVEVVSKTGLAAERPTVFYQVDSTYGNEDTPWTTGGDTFQNDLIRLAGGRNIAASRSGWYQMSIEEILDADPEIIIFEDYQFGVSPEDIAARSNWTGITAVTEDNIFPIIDPNLTCRQGPRVIEGLEVIAEIIHPELFE